MVTPCFSSSLLSSVLTSGTHEPQPVLALVQPLIAPIVSAPSQIALTIAPLSTFSQEQIVASSGSAIGPIPAGAPERDGRISSSGFGGSVTCEVTIGRSVM